MTLDMPDLTEARLEERRDGVRREEFGAISMLKLEERRDEVEAEKLNISTWRDKKEMAYRVLPTWCCLFDVAEVWRQEQSSFPLGQQHFQQIFRKDSGVKSGIRRR